MINRVGYTDNRTSFGAYFKSDSNKYLDKLFTITTELCPSGLRFARITEQAMDLRYKARNHELEIISLSEGTTQKAIVRNNSTGAVASFETNEGLHNLLLNMLERLNFMAKNNNAFWSENSPTAKLYRLLTGQKNNSIPKV